MAYSDTIKLVVGDTLPELNFTLKDSNTADSIIVELNITLL